MILDLASVLQLFQHLKEKLTNDDQRIRARAYSFHERLRETLMTKLGELVATHQQEQAALIKSSISNLAPEKLSYLMQEKKELLFRINRIIYQISTFEALLYCVLNASAQGTNGCQEHAILVSLALLNLYGVNAANRIECIQLIGPDGGSHEFVVINRSGTLNDVNSWGVDCLVLDAYGNWFNSIDKLPEGTAVRNLKDYGELTKLKISVAHVLDMGLADLTVYSESSEHPFHKIEKMTHEFLSDYCNTFVKNSIKKGNLPELKFLPKIELLQNPLFTVISSHPSVDTNDTKVPVVSPQYCPN